MVSVIIPVKNGEFTLKRCINSLKRQELPVEIEIIIIDSESIDNSVEIVTDLGCKVIYVRESDFNHGLTRNLGVVYALGELIFFTTQDAYLAEVDQLKRMLRHFEDPQLQAVVGMQAVPHERDKNPARWYKRFSPPVTTYQHFDAHTYARFREPEKYNTVSCWDNVNVMYRRSALQHVPFQKSFFAEDKLWARDALSAGMKLAFDPSLVVYHYHHRDFVYSFRVQYIFNYSLYRYFKILPGVPPIVRPVLTSWYLVWKNNRINASDKFYWTIHNFLSELGGYLSHLAFIIIEKLGGKEAVGRSLEFFCNEIPQGKIKDS